MKSIDAIVDKILRCPVCSADMYVSENRKSAYCRGERRHCFDFSSDGYLGLSLCGGGDSKAAVRARKDFLGGGYYSGAADAICRTLAEYVSDAPSIIDAGCGEGYYTSRIADMSSCAVGFDLSKFACAYGAKSAAKEGRNNLLYATASVFELPVKNDSADCVVNIFAPCAEEEFSRIIKRGGILAVVGAGENHLMGLKRVLYDTTYQNRERADLPCRMKRIDRAIFSDKIRVEGHENIMNLFAMTPYYWRTGEDDRAKLEKAETIETEIEFEINVYKNSD